MKEWPEVFEDLYMDTMPVAYVDTMILEFKDGRIWSIDIRQQLKNADPDDVADKLFNTLKEYKDSVSSIDFKIDIDRLKSDIKNRTDKIF